MKAKTIFKAKKKGFTLIELLAVITIILIMAGIMFPKLIGYVNEGKKLKVVDQCRKVVMASESYELKNISLNTQESVSSFMKKSGITDYLDSDDLKNIDTHRTTLQNCYDIVKGADFELVESNGEMILNSSTIGVSKEMNERTNDENQE